MATKTRRRAAARPRRSPVTVSRVDVSQLRDTIDQCRRDLEIQFKRIAQMQVELDEIRRASMRTAPPGAKRPA